MILEGTYVKILVLNVFCCFFLWNTNDTNHFLPRPDAKSTSNM